MSLRPGVNATVRVFSKCSLHSQRKRRWRGGLLTSLFAADDPPAPGPLHARRASSFPVTAHATSLRDSERARPSPSARANFGLASKSPRSVSLRKSPTWKQMAVSGEPPGSWTSSSARRGSITTVFVLGGCYYTLTTSPLADRRNLESYSSVAEPKHAGAKRRPQRLAHLAPPPRVDNFPSWNASLRT